MFTLIFEKHQFHVPKTILEEKLLIFEDKTLLESGAFTVLSPVPFEIFENFVHSLENEIPNVDGTNAYYYLSLSLELGYVELEKICEKIIMKLQLEENIEKIENDEDIVRKLKLLVPNVKGNNLCQKIIEKFDKTFLTNESFISLPIDLIFKILEEQKSVKQNDFFDFIVSKISNVGSEALLLSNLIDPLELPSERVLEYLNLVKYMKEDDQNLKLLQFSNSLPLLLKLSTEVINLKSEITNLKKNFGIHNDVYEKTFSMESGKRGVLDYLKRLQTNKFEKKFVVSQSSRDIYNIINKQSKDVFRSGNTSKIHGKQHFWISFEFPHPISIVGLMIYYSNKDKLENFSLSSINGTFFRKHKKNKQINNDKILPENNILVCQFDEQKTNILTIKQEDGLPFEIKSIEIASLDQKFPNGVFEKLVNDANGDPHKAKVNITAANFDFETFTSFSELTNISTLSNDVNWFQIEFLEGKMCVNGYRLKRSESLLLRGWKVYGSDDDSLPISHWKLLDERYEETILKYKIIDYYSCQYTNNICPFKFIRLLTDTPKWNNTPNLTFFNLDFYGVYSSTL